MPLKVEHDGKVFPVSNDSDTVVRALQTAAKRAHVQLSLKCRVVNVVRSADMYRVDIANGHSMYAHFVLVATGGALRPHSWAEQLGHVIIPTVPSLFTFGISDDRLVGLAGVSVPDCTVQLVRHDVQDKGHGRRRKRHDSQLCQRGPVLITHWGLSGPAILALSAFGARVLHETKYHMTCCVDWMPHLSLQEKRQVLYEARLRHAMKNVSTVSPCGNAFPRRLWHALAVSIVGITGTEKWKTVSNNIIDKFAHVLHSCKFEVSSKGAFKEEFVTAGGVALSGVNMKTFESKHSPGLFFAGETLDVDGKTGGFNLGFAWSSGYVAGNAIAENILSQQATQ